MSKKFKLIFFFITLIFSFYYFINSIMGKNNFEDLKSLLKSEQKEFIKKYFFPYKFISDKENEIFLQKDKALRQNEKFQIILTELELKFKNNNFDIPIKKGTSKLSNNKNLEKYEIVQGFYYGINNLYPGSSYIDFYKNDLFGHHEIFGLH